MRVVTVAWELDTARGAAPLRYSLAVDADNLDPIERDLMSGRWSPSPALRWLLDVLQPDDRVLDLGAHIGTFALPAAAAGAEVTAVEASPRNASLLRAAREHNRFANLTIVERAVDAVPGPLTFLDAGPVSTIETASVGSASGDLTFTAEATTVDALGDHPFDWAKIDIEGAEVRALHGAPRLLRQVKGLVIESNGHALHDHGSSPAELVHLLREAGLQVYGVEGRRLYRLGRRLFQPETSVDYLATPAAPPLPLDWGIARKPSAMRLSRTLATELGHPVTEHRLYAHRVADEAPLPVRLVSAGRAVRTFLAKRR